MFPGSERIPTEREGVRREKMRRVEHKREGLSSVKFNRPINITWNHSVTQLLFFLGLELSFRTQMEDQESGHSTY